MADSPPATPARIFISYRREDTAHWAGWLFDRLADRFGDDQVAKDVDSIDLGVDFVGAISDAVGSTDVLLALIGDQWLTIADDHGRPRLDDPDDFVRLEIEAALAGGVRVIPILVDGARMPAGEELPPSLAPLARRVALELRPSRFDFDRLLTVLERILAKERVPAAAAREDRRRPEAEERRRAEEERRQREPSERPPRPAEAKPGWRRRFFWRRRHVRRSQASHPLSAAELAESRAKVRSEPARGPSDTRAPAGLDVDADERADAVDCTVFAPAFATPGDEVFVQVFAHLMEHAQDARSLAEEFDADAERRAFMTLEAIVRRGSSLMFELQIARLTVRERVHSLTWRGRPVSAQFDVNVPQDAMPGAYIGTVTVSLDSVPIGHVKFKLAVVLAQVGPGRGSGPVGDDAKRYKTAFVSYSSKDRQAVLERVQMLKPLGIEYFQDLLDLDPGDRWERELYRSIDDCDLFLLFWSSQAKASRWVRNEAQYALKQKGGDDFAQPEIRPVIIEGPPIPPPWPELAHLHFGDSLVYLMAGLGS
jgi:hypothetical protein